MSSQGRREESLIEDLDQQYGSSAPAIAVGWRCRRCHVDHFVKPGEPLLCPNVPAVVADGRHLLTC